MDDESLTPIHGSAKARGEGETIAETRRLVLRPFDDSDAAFIVALLNDPAFLQYIGDRQVRSLADASDYIARGPQAMYAAHGFGLYLVIVRATGEKAGMCGILKRDALEDPDVGFAFLPAFRGHGYAREALDAVLSLAIDVHGLTRLAAIVDPANARSVGLLERAGFRTERRITMPDETTELLLMGMDL